MRALQREGLRFFSRRFVTILRRTLGYQRVVVFRATAPKNAAGPETVRELSPVSACNVPNIPWDAATIAVRSQQGARLFATHEGLLHKSFGWVTEASSMWIGETRCRIVALEPRVWIWDCVTPAEFRGQGHYPALLEGIIRRLGHERTLIYCRAENKPSSRGIEKAGFIEIGSIIRLLRWAWARPGGDARVGFTVQATDQAPG